MHRIYIKQALQLLRQNKLISIISIAGTALAIMMIMVIILIEQVKNISIAPEPYRNRTMYMNQMSMDSKTDNWNYAMGIEYSYYKSVISQMKTPETVTALSSTRSIVKRENSLEFLSVSTALADAGFWKIMLLDFIEGRPFGSEEAEAGMKQVVVSRSVAEKLFGKENVLNESIEIDFAPYRIIGVVEDVPAAFTYAQADIWIPYTSLPHYEDYSYDILMLARSKHDFDAIEKEIRELERHENTISEEWVIAFAGPHSHRAYLISGGDEDALDVHKKANRRMATLFVLLLLIPAINLSSFSMTRVKKRMEEIGIRKAFGATRPVIMQQVLYENMVTSLIGGVIGLLLSYGAVLLLKNWLLGIKSWQVGIGGMGSIPIEAFVSWPIWVSVFAACILLNVLSAAIPAYRASRVLIVDSLTQNKE